MKTHTELLNQLIDAVYALPFSTFKEAHDLQMLAAEIKGQMMAHPLFTMDTLKIDGLTDEECGIPDADGWIENTGEMPECEIKAIRFANGKERDVLNAASWIWKNHTGEYSITHYKPA
jgi:hypothetical protein